MPLILKDRVMETTASTGTGTITLDGAATTFQSFSAIGDGNTTYYAILGGTEWEVGLGTYTSSGTTLSRDVVLESSNAGSLVNFSAGTKNVICTYPAEKAVFQDTNGNVYSNNDIYGFTTTVTAAGTTTLTATSTYFQVFTGTTTQTVQLPVVSTLSQGISYHIVNNSTGTLTVNSSGGNLVISIPPSVTSMVTCILTTGTTASSWEAGFTDFASLRGTGAAVLANPLVSSTTSITSPLAWNSDSFDIYAATAQAGALTINADSGTPANGRKVIFRLACDGTARVITFTGGASKAFRPIGVNLTTSGSNFTYTLTINKTTYFGAIYNAASDRWDVVAISQEA